MNLLLLLGFLAICWVVGMLVNLNERLKKIMASQADEAAALTAIRDQLSKAAGEIVAKIQALTDAVAAAGATSPEVDAATADLKAAAQALDDIVPDAPTT